MPGADSGRAARRRVTLVLAIAANFTQVSARLAISPLVPDVIDAFRVSKAEVGLALTLMWATYALLQYPSGLLADRFGERRVVLAGLGSLSVGSLLLAASPTFFAFGAAVVLLGIGAGTYFTPGASLLTRRFENTGRVMGLHTAGAAAAGLVAPAVAALVATRSGWRTATLLGVALSLPLLVSFATVIAPVPVRHPELDIRAGLKPDRFVAMFSRPRVAYSALLGALNSFSFQAFVSFFPTFLVEYWSLSEAAAGVAFSGVFLIGVGALWALGTASERVGRDAALVVPLTASATGYVVVLVVDSVLAVALAVGLLGVGLAWGGIVQARVMDVLGTDERGAGFGLVRTTYVLVGALGSVVTGLLADGFGWRVAYGLAAALLLTGVAIIGVNRVLGLEL